MSRTKRIAHIKSLPDSGYVKCPACHAFVNINEKYCPNCNQLVNYTYNRNIIANWSIDLLNNSVGEIKNGLVPYTRTFGQGRYNNIYSLKYGRDLIPEHYSSYDIRTSITGQFIIHKGCFGGGEYGLLDKNGGTIIPPVCEYIGDFDKNGCFIFKQNGKVGVLNVDNHIIIPIKYNSIKRSSLFNEYYFIVCDNNKYGIIDSDNRIVVPLEYDSIGEYYGEGLVPICKDNKWGYYNINKKSITIPFKFDNASPFREGTAKVCMNTLELFIDEEGFPTLPGWYGNTKCVENGRVVIRNRDGMLVPERLFDPQQCGRDLMTFSVNGKVGAICPDGSFAIQPEYDELFILKDDLCPARIDNLWGVITTNGDIVLPFKYHYTWVFDGIIKIRSSPNGRLAYYGYLDRWGNTVIPQEYASLSGPNEGLMFYESFDSCQSGIMDKFGNYVEYVQST